MADTTPTPAAAPVQATGAASDPITAGLNLAGAIIGLFSDERARHLLDEKTHLLLDLAAERRKPVNEQDDEKIVALIQRAAIVSEAALEYVQLVEARKK